MKLAWKIPMESGEALKSVTWQTLQLSALVQRKTAPCKACVDISPTEISRAAQND
jgi:hypothetical protein